jgi:glycosyltransferase involved in cell wall biosynthesis
MPNICIISPFAYSAMVGNTSGHIGGVETQTALLAKWLTENTDHNISIVTWNESSSDDEYINGVRVIKLCKRSDGIPLIKFFHPRWTSLIKALKRADADVYYQNCAEYVTGQVALWCRINRRKFIYSVASDPDCDPNLPTLHTYRERLLYKYGLTHSDAIITQTSIQQSMLRTGFSLNSHVLPMPISPPPTSLSHSGHMHDGEFRVIWVGRIASVKRAEVLLEIAASAPDIIFEIAGGEDQEHDYYQNFLSQAKQLKNVVLHGKLDRDRLNKRYQHASVLCNTSIHEGFPNTFIEAWSHGIPVVSTINPDNLISTQELGIIANSTTEFVRVLAKLKTDKDLWNKLSSNAKRYYLENHSIDIAMRRFLQIFESTL